MSALELIQLAMSSGILAGGVGVLKWGLGIERRLYRVELKQAQVRERVGLSVDQAQEERL
jgi:hypothetical protein